MILSGRLAGRSAAQAVAPDLIVPCVALFEVGVSGFEELFPEDEVVQELCSDGGAHGFEAFGLIPVGFERNPAASGLCFSGKFGIHDPQGFRDVSGLERVEQVLS